MISAVLHADVDRHDVSLQKHALPRRNPVNYLVVDRAADACREIVQALERRHRAVVTAYEFLRNPVEIGSGQSRPYRTLHLPHGLGENFAAFCHYLDLALRLELDHASSASSARPLISPGSPTASMVATSIFLSFIHSITGAV